MTYRKSALSVEASALLDSMKHPLRAEIDLLRTILLDSDKRLEEHVKWNGPNYTVGGLDRITMKVQPQKLIQLIFHRGAKVLTPPKDKLINDAGTLLEWKGNDRAVATFKTAADITTSKQALITIVKKWIDAT